MRKLKCILGIHNKVKIESTAFNTIKYIDRCMDQYPEEFENVPRWKNVIIKKMCSHTEYKSYDLYPWYLKYEYNFVCIDCYKCFNIVDFEKENVNLTVEYFVEKIRAKKLKKLMAEDLYKEKCKNNA